MPRMRLGGFLPNTAEQVDEATVKAMLAEEIAQAQSWSISMPVSTKLNEGVPPDDDQWAEFAKVLDAPSSGAAALEEQHIATAAGGSDALASLLQGDFPQTSATQSLLQRPDAELLLAAEPEPEPPLAAEPESEPEAASEAASEATVAGSDARAQAMLVDGIATHLPPAAVAIALQLFRKAGSDGHALADQIEVAMDRAEPAGGSDLPGLAGECRARSPSLAEEMERHGLSESDQRCLREEGVGTLEIFRMLENEDFEACGIDIAQRRAAQAAKDKSNKLQAASAADAQDIADTEAIHTLLRTEGGQLSDAEQAVLNRVGRLSDVCGLRVAQIKASLKLTIADARMLCNILERSPFVQRFQFRLLDRWLLLLSEQAIAVLQDEAAEAGVQGAGKEIVAWLYTLGLAKVECIAACGDRQLPGICKETRVQKKSQKKALLHKLTESDAAVVEAMMTPLCWSEASSGIEKFYSSVIPCCAKCSSLRSRPSSCSPTSSGRAQLHNSVRNLGSGELPAIALITASRSLDSRALGSVLGSQTLFDVFADRRGSKRQDCWQTAVCKEEMAAKGEYYAEFTLLSGTGDTCFGVVSSGLNPDETGLARSAFAAGWMYHCKRGCLVHDGQDTPVVGDRVHLCVPCAHLLKLARLSRSVASTPHHHYRSLRGHSLDSVWSLHWCVLAHRSVAVVVRLV
jgi:hypothetical protein